ncbi:MAG: efflux RND transporter periplasmic adaptor subunit [Syntrophomonadaceae bacterium]
MQAKGRLFTISLITLLILSTLAGCSSQKARQNQLVATEVAVAGEVESRLELGGVLLPAQTADISSRITGQVVALPHKVGDQLQSGDILMVLDTQALQGQLMQAEANYKAAQAAAEAAENSAVISKTNLDAAQASFDRIQTLFNAGAVSQSQMDEARDKLTIAQQQYKTASGPSLSQGKASAEAAYASVKNYQIQIDNSTIRTPIGGVLVTRNVNIGQVVTAGTAVISVVDTATLKLKATISQDQLRLITPGQQMEVTVDSYPGIIFKGSVTSIGPMAVSTGQVFPLEVTLTNDKNLMPGLSAHSALTSKASGIVIPREAVRQSGDQSWVFVVEGNIARQREVTTGLSDDRKIVIVSGLSAGERVAITDVGQLSDGKSIDAR